MLLEASERLETSTSPATSIENVMKELVISEEELAAGGEVVME